MHIAVISDVHCAGRSCQRQMEFIAWLDTLEADALWMLGDVLHYGWDFSGKTQPEFEPVFEAIDRVVHRGVQIRFIPGNHDFALGSLIESRWGGLVHGPQVCDIDGVRIYVGHGDELDESFGYRLTKGVLRGRGFKLFMRCLGPRLGTRLLKTLAGGGPEVSETIWPDVQARLCTQLDQADIAIVGHIHAPWERQTEQGLAVVLGPGISGARRIVDGQLR